MEVTVHSRLSAVPAADWERLGAGRTPFHRLAWLRAAPAPGPLRLLVARRGGEPVGLLPLHLVQDEGHYYHSPRHLLCGFREEAVLAARGRSTSALRAAAAAPWLPAALAAVPYGYRGGVVGPPGGPAAAETAAALADAAGELCRREGVRLLLHYGLVSDGDDDALLETLGDRGCRPFVAGAHCDLEVAWPELDGYFRALGERGRRLRSRHRHAAGAGSRSWSVVTRDRRPFPEPMAAEAATLFARAARRHGDREPPSGLHRALLDGAPTGAAGPHLGCRHLLTGRGPDGRLTSALLVLEDGGVLYPKLFGARVRDDYFYLTYSRLVELAIALGARRIEYGGGGHRAKLLRGARLRWLLASAEVYDPRLAGPLLDLLPVYEAAKVEHFTALATEFQADHAPPPLPVPVPAPSPSPPFAPRPSPRDLHALEKGAPP